MTSESQEAKNDPPLEVVGDEAPAETTSAPAGEPEGAGGRGGGLRKVFWIAAFALVLLAVAALGTTGYLGQRELRERITSLEGELITSRAALATEQNALDAERARADSLQTTMARVNELSSELSASLLELQRLTGSPPAAPAASEEISATAPAAETQASETTEPAEAVGAAADAPDPSGPSDETLEDPPAAGEVLEMGDAAPQRPPIESAGTATEGFDEIAVIERAVPDDATPSILESPSISESTFADGAATNRDLGNGLSEDADPESIEAAAAAAGSELPAVSLEAPFEGDTSGSEASEAADAKADELEPSGPVPLWQRIVARLRALAPSE